jgi:uncharacterized protein YlxP (DUF503 family)
MGLQDEWQSAVIVCAMVGNDRQYLEPALQTISKWVKGNWPDGEVLENKIEIII